MKKILTITVLLFLPIFSLQAKEKQLVITEADVKRLKIVGDEKLYPPYPEVWGYDLRDYFINGKGYLHLNIFHAPDGDMILIFVIKEKDKDDFKDQSTYENMKNKKLLNEYGAIKFFEGRFIKIGNIDDYSKFKKINKLENPQDDIYMGIKLNNGTYIGIDYKYNGRYCANNDLVDISLLKGKTLSEYGNLHTFNEGVQRYSIFTGLGGVLKYQVEEDDGSEECYLNYGIVSKVIGTMTSTPIKLQDNTFIAYNRSYNVVLRIDDDMKTKFKTKRGIEGTHLKSNFYILPYSVVESIESEVIKNKESWEQGVHDRLIAYLEEKQTQEQQNIDNQN